MSRSCVIGGAAAGLMLLGGCATQPGSVSSEVMTQQRQAAATPEQILEDLKEGNRRFAAGRGIARDYLAQVDATAAGQFPQAIVLGCLDSRVPPELVFDQGIGDIFVGRVAGNFENVDMLGSMEFGTAVAGSKVIVVLGHTDCGAVKGTIADARLGNLTATLANIQPVVEQVRQRSGGPYTADNTAFVNAVTEANVRRTVSDILDRSEVLRDRVAAGDLLVVGGVYDLSTGRIDWLDS